MPNFLVVRCCNCNIFQVQQENKKRKFSCKICNYKQSVLRIYLESTNPSNCRAHVQECNAKIIPLLEEKKKLKSILNYGNYDERYQNSGNRTIDSYFKRDKTKDTNKSYDDNINDYNDYGKKNSHWNMYLSDSENDSQNEEENEVKGKEETDSLNEGKKLNELNNIDNEKEEELAKNLIEKIAESISKNKEDDTESSQEDFSSDDEPENDTQDIIEINNNSALSKYYNNRMYDNSNTNTNKEIGRNPMYFRNRKRNIVYDKNDILNRTQNQKDLSKYQNRLNKRPRYSSNNNNQNIDEINNQNNEFTRASSLHNFNINSMSNTSFNNYNTRNIESSNIYNNNNNNNNNIYNNSNNNAKKQRNSIFNLTSLK